MPAPALIPALLEVGSKDPVIVTEITDLDVATAITLRALALSTGQAWRLLERVYVYQQLYDEFVRSLVQKASGVGINWPDLHQGEIGPFIWGRQADVVQE